MKVIDNKLSYFFINKFMKILLAWIGSHDLEASRGIIKSGLGPIGQVVAEREFERIVLLCNYSRAEMIEYEKWIKPRTSALIEAHHIDLSSPMDFGEIYTAVIKTIDQLKSDKNKNSSLVFHISPGTSAMAAVWIILAKTKYPAELLQSSIEKGVQVVSVPFDISAEFISGIIHRADEQLEKAAANFNLAAEFTDVVFQSAQMTEVVEQAQIIARHNVPVLIEGETGTGKELFASAIHRSSQRKDKPFIAVNCGAIPAELIESELFGHKKGAFTGADKDRSGYFREADGGTIFLDEIGELPLRAQVRLLRVLQEKEVTPVGSNKAQKIDVRLISATNRNLLEEVSRDNFREDLFYRLAVFPLYLPPLRERTGDISLLANFFLENLNKDNVGAFWKSPKKLTSGARNVLINHRWTGNVRELQNTLLRACVLTRRESISETDFKKALFVLRNKQEESVLDRSLGDNFSLQNLINEVASHYLNRALIEAGNNKSKAAKLVGLANYQTFDNWLNKYQ